MLNKTICVSKKFQELPNDTCRLLATWVIAHLDKNGVYHGDPAIVKSYVFPRRSDVTIEDVDGYLDAMEAVGLIVRFTAKQDSWQWWPGFPDNQAGLRADRETTDFPPPPDEVPQSAGVMPEACRSDSGNDPEACRNDAGKKPAEEKLSEVEVNRREVEVKANAYRRWEEAAGMLSPLIAEELGDLVDEYSDKWVCASIEEAGKAGARLSVNYITAILDRWKREGFRAPFKGGNGKGKGTQERSLEAIEEWG